MTYSYSLLGNSTFTMATQNNRDDTGILYFEMVSASKVTEEKLKVMAIIIGKNDIKISEDRLGQQQPQPGVYERFRTKLKLDGGRVLEKCLN